MASGKDAEDRSRTFLSFVKMIVVVAGNDHFFCSLFDVVLKKFPHCLSSYKQ